MNVNDKCCLICILVSQLEGTRVGAQDNFHQMVCHTTSHLNSILFIFLNKNSILLMEVVIFFCFDFDVVTFVLIHGWEIVHFAQKNKLLWHSGCDLSLDP